MKTFAKAEHRAIPSSTEVRAELQRIVASPIFVASPQLAAFLTFVVEATLDGNTDNLKGYTIAVGALGRGEDFDPQTDPIVRVEAGRLRRALERYYAEFGTGDPVRIDLPRGSYVPAFATGATASVVAVPVEAMPGPPRSLPWHRRPASMSAVVAIVLLAVGAFGLFDVFVLDSSHVGAPAPPAPAAAPASRAAIDPVVLIEPVQVDGPAGALSPEALHARLSDAIARSDNVTLVAEPHAAGARASRKPDYRLVSAIGQAPDGRPSLSFRLIDAADSTVVWTGKFDDPRIVGDPAALDRLVVRDVTTRLVAPYGVLFAHRRAKLMVDPDGDIRQRCFFDAFDYMRERTAAQHVAVRDCLDRALAADPSFAAGHSLLAMVVLGEYLFNMPARPGEAAPLDRALTSAVQALRVKPASAFAHAVLVDVYATRGEFDDAMAAGRRAMELNPYDATVNFIVGSQMIFRGDIARGREVLAEYMRLAPVPPPRATYAMFLATYIAGDMTEATRHAGRLTNPNYPFGHFARALTFAKSGDMPRARESLTRFYALQPAWKADPRGELRKHHPAPALFDPLAAGIEEAARLTMM